jgi:hypothetical protein
MAFVSELFDQMRDLLNDSGDTQVPFATKKLFLNRGIARMWPKVWRLVSISFSTEDDVLDYEITVPWSGASDYEVIGVELDDPDTGMRYRFDEYDLIPGDEDLTAIFRFTQSYPPEGGTVYLRVASAIPFIAAASYAAAGSETWTGPDRAMSIPVWYAMSLATLRKLDDRQDTNRYSTLIAENGVTDNDIITAGQTYMGQFELELSEADKPLPIARD